MQYHGDPTYLRLKSLVEGSNLLGKGKYPLLHEILIRTKVTTNSHNHHKIKTGN